MSQATNQTAPRQGHDNAALAANHSEEHSGMTVVEELRFLREENASLRCKAEELDQMLSLALEEAEGHWAERQREYEKLIEEKSEVIRTLHLKNAELLERAIQSEAAFADIPEGELPERQELFKLQRELTEQRQRLQEDEEQMIAQLRDMELALAKDRAELARQSAEIQRLQSDMKHELELSPRKKDLRDKLTSLRPSAPPRKDVSQPTPLPGSLPSKLAATASGITKSGLFRRIFGAGQ